MIKLYIFNLDEFLCLADHCSGPVMLWTDGGKPLDIWNSRMIQKGLYQEYRKNGGPLCLRLTIPDVKDYFRLVNFSIGDM